ncbi:unnamed protein product [Mesocestoides corti]|uniref:Uncharacterized protein n=1 Tax=Mesocestoides corti TaxID=53468 RepID=A0A0R3UAX7_MESCO|nr:unnamed protein product [Mesocestoides corti]
MDLQKTLHEIPNYIKVLDAVTNELEQVKKQIISLRTGCLAGRSAGAAVGTVGTVISIIGFIGAPLTGGLSLAATAGGMTTGLVGGAAVGIAEGVQHHQKQDLVKRIKELETRIKEADQRLMCLVNDIKIDEEEECEEVSEDETKNEASWFSTLIPKAIEAGRATKAAFAAANKTRRALKMATKSLIVTDVLFTVFEVASIAKDWSAQDPTVEDIDRLIKTIQ